VLRRMLNVAVRKRRLTSNPCARVEFPGALKGMFRPHYVTWSEQRQLENNATPHLRNAIRIIAETGLRVKKELLPMKKNQIDFLNGVLWIPDSNTPNGVAEIPLTKLGLEAFRNQTTISGKGDFLMLRQGDSQDFKKYSQMKLQMKREALDKINRQANEMSVALTQQGSGERGFDTVLTQ
jgi:integrase